MAKVTFALLDQRAGVPEPAPDSPDEFPLPAWYRRVRGLPIDELTVEDVCKACRQRIHVEHTVPRALRILEETLLAGEIYEGELLVALASIPRQYWTTHDDQRMSLASIIGRVLRMEGTTADVKRDAQELLDSTRM